ncbi:MAG: hypothetical protein JNL70_11425 [Saprospiraceae bacterium]|nr:hypothetical protein [Saprospiraceae bacterium]
MLKLKTFKIVAIFVLLNLINHLFAQTPNLQKGYYITQTNDSVMGYFNIEKIKSNRINFYRTSDKQDKEVLTPWQVKKIITQDSTTIYAQDVFTKDSTERIFLYSLILGEASLFVGRLSSSEREIFYLRSASHKNEIKRINEANPGALFAALYPKCAKDLSNSIRYNLDNLTKNVIQLNQCLNPRKEVLKNKDLSKIFMSFGVRLATANNTPSIKLWWNTLTPHTYQNLGIGIDASLHFTKNLSLDFGLLVSRRKILVDSFGLITNLVYYRDQKPLYSYRLYYHSPIDARFMTWELPWHLNYHFNKVHQKWKPYISAGFSVLYSTNFKVRKDLGLPQKVEYSSSTPSPSSLGLEFPSFKSMPLKVFGRDHYSFSASVGTFYKITEHTYVNMGMKYAYDTQYFESTNGAIQTKVNRWEFFLAYMFDKQRKP